MWTRISIAALTGLLAALASPAARAQSVTLLNGSTVNYQQNNVTQSGTGTLSGTIQQAGSSTSFTCTYDAVSGQFTGSAACGQILGGAITGGLNVRDLEQQIVNARVTVASAVSADANLRLLDGLIQSQAVAGFAIDVQVGGTGGSGAAPGGFGPTAFGGGSFLDDDRLGREKSGHDYIFTVGVDHRGENLLIGGYVGYLTTDISLKSLNGNLSSDGWLAGAYLTYLLNQTFSVTASGGYSDTSADLRRTFAGAPVTASFGHNEFSGSITGNAVTRAGDSIALLFLGGFTYGSWKDNAYTDSRGLTFAKADGDNTWAKLGTVASFLTGGAVRPYAQATYSRLISNREFGEDRDALSIGGGLSIGTGRLTGSLEVNTVLLQAGQSNTSVGINIRLAL